jgi:hypothetical protein
MYKWIEVETSLPSVRDTLISRRTWDLRRSRIRFVPVASTGITAFGKSLVASGAPPLGPLGITIKCPLL